jgi:hypothetical protein
MIQMPANRVTAAARHNLERFRATSAASELEDDPRTWTVVEWSWAEGPPMRVHLRNDTGEVVDFVMDASGSWHMRREPLDRIRM